jgi:prepilin peptidase CpaA
VYPVWESGKVMKASLFAGSTIAVVGFAIFATLLLCACVSDVQRRRIPNSVAALLAAAGIAYSVAASLTPGRALIASAGGLAVGLALWLPFYAVHWLGAGDVKLFAAAGAWLGPARTIEGALIGALAGGVLAAVWMLFTYGLMGTAATAAIAISTPRKIVAQRVDTRSRRAVPYGVALAIGAMAAALLPLP